MVDKVIFLTSGTSWTVPNDWNNAANKIEMIDGGGSFRATGETFTGGNGGEYRRYVNVSLTKGASASYAIGQPSSNNAFGTGSTHTGCVTPAQTQAGGAGATDADSVLRGWGGGAGGSASNGGSNSTGVGASGGSFWTSTHNASGGVSVATAASGTGDQLYGGGGSGVNDPESGGSSSAGNQGIIVVTYTPLPAITGSMGPTGPQDTFAGAGAVDWRGALAATDTNDSFAAAGTVANPGVTGTLAATDTVDAFAGAGTVTTGFAGSLTATDAKDGFAASGSVQNTASSGAGGGAGSTPADWAYMREIRAIKAKRGKVVDLAPPPIIDAAEEARKAAAMEKAQADRRERIKGEMQADARKEMERQAKAQERAARQAAEERKAEAAKLVAALDPRAVEREHRRQRQVTANHMHHARMGEQIGELAGHVLHHLATTPRKK